MKNIQEVIIPGNEDYSSKKMIFMNGVFIGIINIPKNAGHYSSEYTYDFCNRTYGEIVTRGISYSESEAIEKLIEIAKQIRNHD